MGIATQPVYIAPPNIINEPDAVFDFYDSFDGNNGLDQAKWYFSNIVMQSTQAVTKRWVIDTNCRKFWVGPI